MHTYRDAISGVRSVWILYPGTETRFYSATSAAVSSSADALPPILDGVGAIPLQPIADSRGALKIVMGCLLGRSS